MRGSQRARLLQRNGAHSPDVTAAVGAILELLDHISLLLVVGVRQVTRIRAADPVPSCELDATSGVSEEASCPGLWVEPAPKLEGRPRNCGSSIRRPGDHGFALARASRHRGRRRWPAPRPANARIRVTSSSRCARMNSISIAREDPLACCYSAEWRNATGAPSVRGAPNSHATRVSEHSTGPYFRAEAALRHRCRAETPRELSDAGGARATAGGRPGTRT